VDLGLGHLVELDLADETLASALALIRSVLSPRPLSAMQDDDVAALVIGGEADGALLRLAGGGALGRRLQAVIGELRTIW